MNDVRNKYVPPAISELAFNCPHCGALAKQFWSSVYVNGLKKDNTPNFMSRERIEAFNFDEIEDPEERKTVREYAEKMAKGRPFLEVNKAHCLMEVPNLSISKCFNCSDISIWIYNRIVWPQRGEAPLPNPDLPDEIRTDYDEASTILDLSPRGAAALLRLGVQKLCKHLGGKGKNIDADIAALVAKGLDVRVQAALDIVRVVGNNAVHPGQIDLKDDRATAEELFDLVNLIAEIMISQPKHIDAMYGNLPENARKAIEKRDKKK